jgi:hypothetical protein
MNIRDFVAKNESIIGCTDQGTFGSTPFMESADIFLATLADVALPDDDSVFLAMHKKLSAEAEKTGKATDSNLVIKQTRMSTELKMWLCAHTKCSRVHLGVDSRKLEQCTAERDCMDVWSIDVPADGCWLQ